MNELEKNRRLYLLEQRLFRQLQKARRAEAATAASGSGDCRPSGVSPREQEP